MVEHLAERDVAWSNVQLFQVDERAVPLDDPARNWNTLQPLAARLPPANRHPMPVEGADADEQYSTLLQETLGSSGLMDVVHLGLGTDGHTASLVPGDPAVDERDRDVCWVSAYQGHRRLTLTQPVLHQARHQVWLVSGRDKADALGDLVQGRSTGPAARVINTDSATLFADAAASGGM
jgi:6-phosphogluconolactonase